jgi:hypothetical protein
VPNLLSRSIHCLPTEWGGETASHFWIVLWRGGTKADIFVPRSSRLVGPARFSAPCRG